MNPKELNEYMATEVMGWRSSGGHYHFVSGSKDGKSHETGMSPYLNWNPTKDIAQALMCAEEVFTQYGITYKKKFKSYWLDTFTGIEYKGRKVETLDDLPLAICKAIREAKGE